MEKGFRISTVSGIADFQGSNVGLESLGFGIPQAKNFRPGDSDYFTCSEKFKTTMTCCMSRVSPLLKRRDTQSDYILFQKHFLRGGIPFYPYLIQRLRLKANQQNWCVTAYRVLFTFVTFRLITRDLDQLEDLERNPRYIGILKGAPNDCFL